VSISSLFSGMGMTTKAWGEITEALNNVYIKAFTGFCDIPMLLIHLDMKMMRELESRLANQPK